MSSKKSDGGVNYADLDPVKRLGQLYGLQTLGGPAWLGVTIDKSKMGESAPALTFPSGGKFTTVLEGLGTKACMAEYVYQQTGCVEGYKAISQCTIAMIVNDLITGGMMPATIQMYFAVGNSEWLKDTKRVEAIMSGWRDACIECGVAWIGGETPSLKRVIDPRYADFAGSAIGFLPEKYKSFDDEVAPGDHIIGFASSGVHANGMTLIQDLAEKELQTNERVELYRKCLVGTRLYVNLIKRMHLNGLRPTRVENMTGHGFRKIMRSSNNLTYNIYRTNFVQPVFKSIQALGRMSDQDMYSSYNMGTGFVCMVRPSDVQRILECAQSSGYEAMDLGTVSVSTDNKKRVILHTHGIKFEEESMCIR